MERAIVVGCPGGGKSTFARRLAAITGLPLHYLDMLWHRPDRTNIPQEEFDRQLALWAAEERWIIDGNYQRSLEVRLERCDTVFFLDLPTRVCLEGVAARRGKVREDMPWIEEEPDPEFLRWIVDFPRDRRPGLWRLLERYRENREIIVFHSRREADRWLDRLEREEKPLCGGNSKKPVRNCDAIRRNANDAAGT